MDKIISKALDVVGNIIDDAYRVVILCSQGLGRQPDLARAQIADLVVEKLHGDDGFPSAVFDLLRSDLVDDPAFALRSPVGKGG